MNEQKAIPDGWLWSPMSHACEKIQDGTHFSPHESKQLSDGPYPYVTAKNVRPSGLDLRDLTYLAEDDHREIYRRCDPKRGDVLLVKDGVNAGDAAINTVEGEISLLSSVCMIRPRAGLVTGPFLRYYLLSPQGYRSLTGQMTGTAIKRIILRKVRCTPVPLAPLNEQHRIVERIDELFSALDAAVAALERASANLKRCRTSILKAAVEGSLTAEWRAKHPNVEPASTLLERILKERRRKWEADQLAKFATAGKPPLKNWQAKYVEPTPPDTAKLPRLPDGWCWGSVEQVGEAITGTTPSTADSLNFGGRLPFVKPTDLNAGYYVSEASDSLSDKGLESARWLPQNTVLVTCIGATIGKTGFARVPCATNQQINAIVVPRLSLLPEWLFWVMCSSFGQNQIKANSSATTLPILNKGRFERLPIPIAPLAEQTVMVAEIEEKLSQIEWGQQATENGLLRALRLRQSVLKQAFEGNLVPQDPSDEPASVLLERLRNGYSPGESSGRELCTGIHRKRGKHPNAATVGHKRA